MPPLEELLDWLNTCQYPGRAVIYFNSTEEQTYFAIHSKGLDIQDPVLEFENADVFEVRGICGEEGDWFEMGLRVVC